MTFQAKTCGLHLWLLESAKLSGIEKQFAEMMSKQVQQLNDHDF